MADQPNSTTIQAECLRCLNEISAYSRCCVLAIVNDTRYNLTCGQHAVTSGEVHRRVPETIKSHDYNIILARKTGYSLRGSVGMVSYEVKDLKSKEHILQIAWHVPWDLALYDVYFNVNFSSKMASKDEVNKLLYDIPPEMRRRAAEYTPGRFELGGMVFEVAMINAAQSILTVKMSKEESPDNLNGVEELHWDYSLNNLAGSAVTEGENA